MQKRIKTFLILFAVWLFLLALLITGMILQKEYDDQQQGRIERKATMVKHWPTWDRLKGYALWPQEMPDGGVCLTARGPTVWSMMSYTPDEWWREIMRRTR